MGIEPIWFTLYPRIYLGWMGKQVGEPIFHLFSSDHGNCLCLFSDRSLLSEMALSVDSSWHRWQWRVRDGLPQSPSEATPLLSQDGRRQSYNLTQQRVVFPNNSMCHQDWAAVSRKYSGNRICTTKYTFLTFLPQNLFEQFHRYTASWLSNMCFNQVFASISETKMLPSGPPSL